MNLEYKIFSKCGRRETNQDRIAILTGPLRSLFVLCDGMGGGRCGDKAAEAVSTGLIRYWERTAGWPDSEKKVIEACRKVSRRLMAKGETMGGVRMGTTMVMASFKAERLTVANCGDSRCYVIRPGEGMVLRTQDHLQDGYEHGPLTRAFFSYGPERYKPDTYILECKPGDTVFLCSDGVHRYIQPEVLDTLLSDDRPLEEISDELVRLCQEQSHDNFSGIIIRIL